MLKPYYEIDEADLYKIIDGDLIYRYSEKD